MMFMRLLTARQVTISNMFIFLTLIFLHLKKMAIATAVFRVMNHSTFTIQAYKF